MLTSLRTVLLRDIETLGCELDLYADDTKVWKEIPGLPNAGGTLVLHLAGNLRHFIGAVLGRTGYVRDREAEFAVRGLSRRELADLVAAAREEVSATLERLDPAALEAPYPLPLAGHTLSTDLFLVHLAVHLGFHLGQLDYHRRAATGIATSAGAVSLTALAAGK